MEKTEPKTAAMLYKDGVNRADIESNNGGRGFARSVDRILKEKYKSNKCYVSMFHQSMNKQARIFSDHCRIGSLETKLSIERMT